MDAPVTPRARKFSSTGSANSNISVTNGSSSATSVTGQAPGSAKSSADGSGITGTAQDPQPLETPKGPPISREATQVPGVHVAQYAQVDVIEQDVGSHVVMRRVNDGSVNATQLLKLAGLDRSRRQRVLDKEIGSKFEKVQGGTTKFQGTWVPLESAQELARQYGVLDILQPLFEFDMTSQPVIRAPTESEIEERRRFLAQSRAQGQEYISNSSNGHASSYKESIAGKNGPSAGDVAAAAAAAAASVLPEMHLHNSMRGGSAGSRLTVDSSTISEGNNDFTTIEPLEPKEGDRMAEQSKEVVTELFLNANRSEQKSLDVILENHGNPEIEIDVPIDDAGHTALHWAAALGHTELVADLINHGANCCRGNRKGESALVRAVLVTNSSDFQSFDGLLDLLYPCLHLGDLQGRTVLHHIALTAGIPGRSDASRYYLDTLLEWAVRWRGSNGVKWLVDELVDIQDANGDTALNIAARLGSQRISQQLMEVGASMIKENRAGLRPTDFGINFGVYGHENGYNSLLKDPLKLEQFDSANNNFARAGSRAPLDHNEKRQELRNKCDTIIAELELNMRQSMDSKDRELKSVHLKLKEATENLNQLNARKKHLEEVLNARKMAQQKIDSLVFAAKQETDKFNAESEEHKLEMPDQETEFNADEPFSVNPDSAEDTPPALLLARIAAYRQNDKQLVQLRNELRVSSLEGEVKYRRVVAQCTHSEESKVDEILDQLLAAVDQKSHEKSHEMDVEA